MAAAASHLPRCFLFSPLLLLLLISLSHAQTPFPPHALVLPIRKAASTPHYLTHLHQRTPLVPVTLLLDLGGRFLWVDCDSGYLSSSYQPARCRSAQCSSAQTNGCSDCFLGPSPGCNNNTCTLFPENTITRTSTAGELAEDVVSIQSSDGPAVTLPSFLFSCAPTSLLQGLPAGVQGMAGLGRSRIALPLQFAAGFSLHRKFALCLSSSTDSKGVIVFGNGPYVFLPGIDVSKTLMYTPLLINPVSSTAQGEPSDEYFIGVKSIKINGKQVSSLNTSLLSIDTNGIGGTKISTVSPYTTLETSIYKALTEAFAKEAMNITRVASVAPFDLCFSSKSIGPAVPTIDLVLQSDSVFWRMFGANSMVSVRNDVQCLAFVDGGSSPRTSIVIGGYQLEDNLLQFDLAGSRLGFSSSLLFRQTTCSSFNTSNA